MMEDRLLIYRFKRGSSTALQRIYEKYRGYLFTIAAGLLYDVNSAEDLIHDVFVSFAQSADTLRLEGSLKWFLATCVANRARDRMRAGKRRTGNLDQTESLPSKARIPESAAIYNEELQLLEQALDELPYEQREAVILRARGQMKFKAIAELQNVSIKTVHSRYRYGLDRLRSSLDGKV